MNKLVVTFIILMATVAGIALGADAKAGAETYKKSCQGCHGADGATPNDAVGNMIGAKIPVLASPEIQAKSDDDIRKAVTTGKNKMPAVLKTATPSTVDDIIAYVRSIAKK